MQGDTDRTKEDWAACVQAYEEQLSAAVLRPKEQFDMFLVMVMRNALWLPSMVKKIDVKCLSLCEKSRQALVNDINLTEDHVV